MKRPVLAFPVLAAALAGAVALSLSAGPAPVSLGQVLRALTGGDAGGPSGETAARVVLALRLPRALLGALGGGALCLSRPGVSARRPPQAPGPRVPLPPG